MSQPIDLYDSYDGFRAVSSAPKANIEHCATSTPLLGPLAPPVPANRNDTDSLDPEMFRRRKWPLLAVSLPVLAVGMLVLWWASTDSDSDPGHAEPATSRPPDPVEDNEPDIVFEETADPVAPPLSATAAQTRPPVVVPPQGSPRNPRPAASASAMPPASAPPASVEPTPPADAPPSVAPPKRPGCEQPIYIDERGIKRYRPECL